MPEWAGPVIGVALGVCGLFLMAWLVRRWWLGRVLRVIATMLGRREAVRVGLQSLAESLGRLTGTGPEDSTVSAEEREDDRRVLEELAHRMKILVTDMEDTALPRDLVVIAEGLEDAARTVAVAAETVAVAAETVAVAAETGAQFVFAMEDLDLDLESAEERLSEASDALEDAVRSYGLSDPTVYGGGLHI